ncbi:hypothetical protein Busp01_46380 [Trinickia caryophylli]|nr:hypothetical protein Busp01_46380 [Trinickia caryophylli]
MAERAVGRRESRGAPLEFAWRSRPAGHRRGRTGSSAYKNDSDSDNTYRQLLVPGAEQASYRDGSSDVHNLFAKAAVFIRRIVHSFATRSRREIIGKPRKYTSRRLILLSGHPDLGNP